MKDRGVEFLLESGVYSRVGDDVVEDTTNGCCCRIGSRQAIKCQFVNISYLGWGALH
jgi:hypothetical protein